MRVREGGRERKKENVHYVHMSLAAVAVLGGLQNQTGQSSEQPSLISELTNTRWELLALHGSGIASAMAH